MAERKHQQLTPAEAQRLGLLGESDRLDARALRARHRAEAVFQQLTRAEQARVSIAGPEGVDRRGKVYRDEQVRRDATVLGSAGYNGARAHVVTRDPEVAEAAQRIGARRAQHAADATVQRLAEEYENQCRDAVRFEAEIAATNHRAALEAKQAELAAATDEWRGRPADVEVAARVRTLQREIEALVTAGGRP